MWWSEGIVLLIVTILRANGEEEEETSGPPPPPLKPLPELAKEYGFEATEHEVLSNGYKMKMFNVKGKKSDGPVVLLVHGLQASSDCWAIRNISMAYALAEAGNDVWLGNFRGNVHGRKHEKLNPDTDEAFWDYSWHELGLEDVPAMIDFVIEKTKAPKIYYIGHSMGTSTFLALMTSKPEYNDKIKEAILLAPVFYSHKYQFILTKDSSMYQMALDTLKQFDEKKKWEAFPRSDVPKNEHQLQCEDLPDIGVSYCNMAFDMTKQFVGEYLPAGQSMKVGKHYMQTYVEGVAMPYDHGEEGNMKKYNQKTPPPYDLSKMSAKVNIFYSQSDQLVDQSDAEQLGKEIPNKGLSFLIPAESFNHVDFLLPTTTGDVEDSFKTLMMKVKEIVKN